MSEVDTKRETSLFVFTLQDFPLYRGWKLLNSDLNEEPENIYRVFYPTVARRVVKKDAKLRLPAASDGIHTSSLSR